MPAFPNWFKYLAGTQLVKKTLSISNSSRNFADTPKKDGNSKQIVQSLLAETSKKPTKRSIPLKVQGTEAAQDRMRVRRARPYDVPRVLRFVREHARLAWPGLAASPAQPQVVLCDYVARTLAQGHTMLAEQELRRGWSSIRGLALCGATCSWDASSIEKWARCVRCVRSRRLMEVAADCMRGPALHDKYKVHSILQVILIVPLDIPKCGEVVNTLAKHTILRGKEVGFPIIRFDVANNKIAEILESNLNIEKEWQLFYENLPEKSRNQDTSPAQSNDKKSDISETTENHKGSIVVYSAKTQEQFTKLTLNKK